MFGLPHWRDNPVAQAISVIFSLLIVAIFIRAILSWFSIDPRNPLIAGAERDHGADPGADPALHAASRHRPLAADRDHRAPGGREHRRRHASAKLFCSAQHVLDARASRNGQEYSTTGPSQLRETSTISGSTSLAFSSTWTS